jgi:hypothetical protein
MASIRPAMQPTAHESLSIEWKAEYDLDDLDDLDDGTYIGWAIDIGLEIKQYTDNLLEALL